MPFLTSEICCLNIEHQQSCICPGCCGYGIHVRALENHRSGDPSRSIHETDASEEEQREIGEKVKGVVAPDSSCTCSASKASGNQEVEIKIEIEIRKLEMLICFLKRVQYIRKSGGTNFDTVWMQIKMEELLV